MSEVKFDTAIQMVQLQNELLTEYGIDVSARTFTLVGEIDEALYNRVEVCLSMLERDNRKAITIKLNSPGGEVHQAFAIIGRMLASPCKVNVDVYGEALSGAFNILAAGHKRRISRFALFMHHECNYETGGRHSEMKDIVREVEKTENRRAAMMEEFTGTPATFWKTEGSVKDRYFTADELIKLGVADEIF